MLKLLIVDDQKTVVDGLLHFIDWSAIGISSALGACSAAEARRILVSQKIDILLCDIEMPVESGLNLVRWMREQEMQTKVIFLTAHAEFSYAQKSVGLGAFDYVVQPAPYTLIRDAVERAVKSLRSEKHQEFAQKYDQVASWKSGQNAARALQLYLSSGDGQELRTCVRLGKLPSPDQPCALVRLEIQRWLSMESWSGDLLTIMIDNAVSEVFSQPGQFHTVMQAEQDRFALLLWEQNTPPAREALLRQLDVLRQVFRRQLECIASLQLLGPAPLEELREAWHAGISPSPEEPPKTIFTQQGSEQEQDVVEKVIRYIDENLDRDLHRQDLADHVFLNPDYLNRLFKKQTGKTLKEFLIEHKMGEAKKMLQLTRLPVSIIAAKVGYDNFSHFSYAYKKVIGQSPLESRNNYQREKKAEG